MVERLSPLEVKPKDDAEKIVASAEFLLEGLYAHKKLSRSEERGFTAQERARRNAESNTDERKYEEWQQRKSSGGSRRGGLN